MKSIYYKSPYQQIIVNKIKGPIEVAFNTLIDPEKSRLSKIRAINKLWKVVPVVNELPEPTMENVQHPNTRILVAIYEEFFKRLKLPTRFNILRTIFKFVIIIYDTDFYRPFIDWMVVKLRISDWKPMGPLQPDPHFFKEEDQK